MFSRFSRRITGRSSAADLCVAMMVRMEYSSDGPMPAGKYNRRNHHILGLNEPVPFSAGMTASSFRLRPS
jgi:hypothetical protein